MRSYINALKLSKLIVIFGIIFFSLPNPVCADFRISATPYEGGRDLRFGRVDTPFVNKEVRLRITSDSGKQYQVFQRLLEPVINERSERLNNDALTSYTLAASNSFGSLYQPQALPLSYVDQLLYISSTSGDNDSFQIIYTAHADKFNLSGNCLGKIIFTLMPIGGGAFQTYIMDVSLEASGEFKVEIKASSGMNVLRLDPERNKKDYATLSFTGNSKGSINIYQELIEPVQNELKEEISKGAIQFFTATSSASRLFYTSPVDLERKRLLICSSEEANDAIALNFVLDEDKIFKQKAGNYQGQLQYTIEGLGISQAVVLDLEIRITPVFKIDVELPQGGLRFANLRPLDQPVLREIKISVKNNLSRPYIISQDMPSGLVSAESVQMPAELFTMKEEIISEKSGTLKFAEFRSVAKGKVAIFSSDDKGSPVQVKIIYRIQPTLNVVIGDYSAMINYSLEEK